MRTTQTALRWATSLAICAMAIGSARADVATAISYDTLNLQHTSWLVPAAVNQSDPVASAVSVANFPPIGTAGHGTYMNIYASSKASGPMEVAIDRLRAGGRVDSVASWHDTINNQSGSSQNYRMNLDLSSLNASMGGFISNTSQRDFRAGFVANVLVNGISVWQTAQTFKLTGNQAWVVKNGVDIGDATVTQGGPDNADFSFALSDYQGSANLGSFASGQSADVTYQLSTFAYWDDPAGCSYECGQVSIRAADPLGAGGSRIVSAPVPELESYALLLGGLGLVAGVVARRRRALLK